MAPKIVDFVEDAGAPGLIAGIGAVILAPVLLSCSTSNLYKMKIR